MEARRGDAVIAFHVCLVANGRHLRDFDTVEPCGYWDCHNQLPVIKHTNAAEIAEYGPSAYLRIEKVKPL